MDGRLAEKRAIVTGASSGIGRKIAEQFVKEGASVVLTARSLDRLEQLTDELGDNAVAIQCDVQDSNAVRSLVESAVSTYDGVDVAVNNAAVPLAKSLEATSDEEMDHVIDTNLKGALRFARAVLPELQQNDGTLLNISSVASEAGVVRQGVYTATKGGLSSVTRQLAAEYGDAGVNVNAIAPGTIKTEMNEAMRERNPDWERNMSDNVPMGRVGVPRDVADTAMFLASDEARYITGQVIVVDGGLSMALNR